MARSILKRFGTSERGNLTIMLGISLIPLLFAAGGAVDYYRAVSSKTRLQNALDAGALGIASSSSKLPDADRLKLGDAIFSQNWKDLSVSGQPSHAHYVLKDGGVAGEAQADVPATILAAVGIDKFNVVADAFVTVPEGSKAEIALVLDYSGSMTKKSGGKVKYIAMKDAATALVEDLAKHAKGRVKFGLVPFSHHVYLTMPKSMVAGEVGAGDWTGCTQDRPYPYNTSDSTPTASDGTRWGQPQAPLHIDKGCAPYAPNRLKVLPLTEDDSAVTGQLAAMKPYEWTHIALGVEFGLHLLAPGAPFTEAAPFGDKSVKKYMVVLTDGEQTEPAFGPAGARNRKQGEANLEELCAYSKSRGITMMTIAFGIEDAPTRTRLKNCATDAAKHYFEVEDGGDIATAFDVIKNQIARQAFLAK